MLTIQKLQTKQNKIITGVVVLLVVMLISFGILKLNETPEDKPTTQDYLLKCVLPGVLVSVVVVSGLHFYKSGEPELVFTKEDFWD